MYRYFAFFPYYLQQTAVLYSYRSLLFMVKVLSITISYKVFGEIITSLDDGASAYIYQGTSTITFMHLYEKVVRNKPFKEHYQHII